MNASTKFIAESRAERHVVDVLHFSLGSLIPLDFWTCAYQAIDD